MRAAAEYYQQHSGASAEDAERAIEYLTLRPDALLLLVRLRDGDRAPLYMDDTLLGYLTAGRFLRAVNYYVKQTGAHLREAQTAVEALFVNPHMQFKNSKGNAPPPIDADGAGLRDLIAAGEIDRAVKVYQDFMGVDEYTARDAIQAMIESP
jgi:hypothetical protein